MLFCWPIMKISTGPNENIFWIAWTPLLQGVTGWAADTDGPACPWETPGTPGSPCSSPLSGRWRSDRRLGNLILPGNDWHQVQQVKQCLLALLWPGLIWVWDLRPWVRQPLFSCFTTRGNTNISLVRYWLSLIKFDLGCLKIIHWAY